MMSGFIKLFSIVLVGIVISAGALAVGYQFGKAVQTDDISISPSIEDNQSNVLSDQQSAEIPDDAFGLYSMYCASCHGTTGDGSTIAPALDNPELRNRLEDSEIKETIANGRSGTAMPAWKKRLTDIEINALTSLIRNWDELGTEQLSELEFQTPCGHGMGNWQWNNSMMGCGGNSGMGHHR